MKLSKEVKQIRLYEGNLLSSYQRFLQLLHKFVEGINPETQVKVVIEYVHVSTAYHRRSKAQEVGKVVEDMSEVSGLAGVSLRSLCAMLLARVDFNYTNNIIQTLLPAAMSTLPQVHKKNVCMCVSCLIFFLHL